MKKNILTIWLTEKWIMCVVWNKEIKWMVDIITVNVKKEIFNKILYWELNIAIQEMYIIYNKKNKWK